MNRFQFLGAQTDESGQEWCYVFDTQTNVTLKSMVKTFGGVADPAKPIIKDARAPGAIFAAPSAVEQKPPEKEHDPTGEMETPEQRALRLKGNKVPPAFLGDIRRMHQDPAKTDGRTDVTPAH